MVSIEMKDLFMAKSGLSRIDQLLGMKNSDLLCLVQSEESAIYFEVWSKQYEKITIQKKVILNNYELSSNVVVLDSDQLAFYGVIQKNGAQCLFIVDIFLDDGGGGLKQNLLEEQLIKAGVSQVETEKVLKQTNEENEYQNNVQRPLKSDINNFQTGELFEDKLGLSDSLAKSHPEQVKEIGVEKQGQSDNNYEEHKDNNGLPFNTRKNRKDSDCLSSFQIDNYAIEDEDSESVIEDINCITNFEHYQKDMMIESGESMSLSQRWETENLNKLKQMNIYDDDLEKSLKNKFNKQEIIIQQTKQNQIISNGNQHPLFEKQKMVSSERSDNSKQSSIQNCSALTEIDLDYLYLGNKNGIRCIYDVDQIQIFNNCIQFYSELSFQCYKETLLVKNTYYMANKDDSFYLLLVLSVYRPDDMQRFAQYVIRRDVNSNLVNNIQVISVLNSHELIIYDQDNEEIIIWSYFSGESLFPVSHYFQLFSALQMKFVIKGIDSVYHFIYRDLNSNLLKILNYDFATSNYITKAFNNCEISRIRSPIQIKQQEAYIIRQQNGHTLLVVCSIYMQHEMTTFWNIFKLKFPKEQSDKKSINPQISKSSTLVQSSFINYDESEPIEESRFKEALEEPIHVHLDSSETDNSDIKTHFVPTFSFASSNIFFFNTSDIHVDVQSAINTFIYNKDIHFKALQIID